LQPRRASLLLGISVRARKEDQEDDMVHLKLLVSTVVALLVLAACTGEAPSPAETAADPGETAGDGPTTEATAEPTMKSGSARLGSGGDVSMAQLPTLMAVERLNEMGYEIEWIEFEGSDSELAAVAAGELDMTAAGMAQQLAAMDAGLDHRFFLGRYVNEFIFVASNDIQSCEDLAGQPVGLHSRTGTSGTLTQIWVSENCGVEPDYIIIEGSENQLIALLQGQIAAASIDLQNAEALLHEAPDDFHVLASHARDLPVYGGTYSAPPEFLAENEGMILDFIRVHLDVWDEIYENPDILLERAQQELPQVDAEILPALVDSYLEFEIFPRDGGLDQENTELSMEIFGQNEPYQNISEYSDVADRSYLDRVLEERGG
jgi:ABC-type nitrate/sulfonate/bicarbonate transport system substrate-binding protein